MNGDGQIDTVGTTIIARHLSGFKGASLTAGLALGVAPSASRPTTAAVVSFLASGCATGPSGAFVQGGNAFGATAVLGTTDNQNMKVSSAGPQASLEIVGGNGLRILKTIDPAYPNAPAVINGSASNIANERASTAAGGGFAGTICLDPTTLLSGRNCRIEASDLAATVGGGFSNLASGGWAVVGGGYGNAADGGAGSVVGGGYGNVSTASNYGTVGGGYRNHVEASYATIPGGFINRADGSSSFAAGQYADALHSSSFVWGDASSTGTIASNAANQFVIRSPGGVHLNPATRSYFGMQTRQTIDLWGTSATTPDEFGIGVQTATAYFRSNSNFCWHKGGTRSDTFCTAGGTGTVQMALRDTAAATTAIGHLYAAPFNIGSDRAVKTAIDSINPRRVLSKVLAMPITSWVYITDGTTRHIGPMAQDFHKAFGLGGSDKSIATVDADGVALAAIQGLHQILKDKDAKIGALEKLNAAMQKKIAAIEKRLGM